MGLVCDSGVVCLRSASRAGRRVHEASSGIHIEETVPPGNAEGAEAAVHVNSWNTIRRRDLLAFVLPLLPRTLRFNASLVMVKAESFYPMRIRSSAL
jgi:hypothetical protein